MARRRVDPYEAHLGMLGLGDPPEMIYMQTDPSSGSSQPQTGGGGGGGYIAITRPQTGGGVVQSVPVEQRITLTAAQKALIQQAAAAEQRAAAAEQRAIVSSVAAGQQRARIAQAAAQMEQAELSAARIREGYETPSIPPAVAVAVTPKATPQITNAEMIMIKQLAAAKEKQPIDIALLTLKAKSTTQQKNMRKMLQEIADSNKEWREAQKRIDEKGDELNIKKQDYGMLVFIGEVLEALSIDRIKFW